MTSANAVFEVKSWNEEAYSDSGDGLKLSRVSMGMAFQGDLEGEGKAEYLMAYRKDGTVSFTEQQFIQGRIGPRSGTFVLQGVGTYENGAAQAALSVVSDTGTGDFVGLKGKLSYVARHGQPVPVTFEYGFD